LIWRPVFADRIPDGLADVRQRWTLPDLLEAHLALDAAEIVDEIERKRRKRPEHFRHLHSGGRRWRQ
jgi:hypothetical protein